MDAFQAADKTLQISEAILDAPSFLRLSDSMLYQIEHSREPNLADARKLIERIRRRKLYRFVDECLLPKGSTRIFHEEEVVSHQDSGSSGVELRPEDIILFVVKLNFGRGDANPIEDILFFKDWEDVSPIQIQARQFSYVLPTVFEERIVRVYLKKHFPDKSEEQRAKAAVKYAFRRFVRAAGITGGMTSPLPGRGSHFELGNVAGAHPAVRDEMSEGSDVLAGIEGTSPADRVAKRSRPS